jgi:hypothetical protein
MNELAETPVAGSDSHVCETAVLDIGGDTGALIIYAEEAMVGEEIEICRPGDLQSRVHNVVRARRAPSGLVFAAVFPALSDGAYDVLDDDGQPWREAFVCGGRVTEVDCRRLGAMQR